MLSEAGQLVEKMAEALDGEQNQKNKNFWEPQPPWGRDNWRGIPKNNRNKLIPFIVEPEKQLWAKILNFSIDRYWKEPEYHLTSNIKMALHKLNHFKDNSFYTNEIAPSFGVVYELSLFGAKIHWLKDRDPCFSHIPLIQNPQDLDKLAPPDFFKSGLMPTAHFFYHTMSKITRGNLNVIFPDWSRGPFSIALGLRGMQNLLMDLILRPDWVNKLMRFITDSYKEWSMARSNFIGKPLNKMKLFNDEIDCPTLSPAYYREFVLPYEIELSNFHGGVVYYHSCGHLTPFFKDILKIPNLDLVHISPWSDLDQAIKLLAPHVKLEVCLNPTTDLHQSNEENMREKLDAIIKTCKGNATFYIRMDAIQIYNNPETDHQKILKWCKLVRELTGQKQMEI